MDSISLINSSVAAIQDAIRAAWPNFPLAPLLKDTQANRFGWREALNRMEAGDELGDMAMPWVVIECGPSQPAGRGGITNHTEYLPIMIALITSSLPVKTTVTNVSSSTTIKVASATGIFPAQRLKIGSAIRTVVSVSGVDVVLSAGVLPVVGQSVVSFDVTAEITSLLEQLRDELYFGDVNYPFQVMEKPSINTSTTSEVNDAIYAGNYAAQGGTLMLRLLVGETWA